MDKQKAVFISPVNVFDKRGNGGAKASLEHLNMLKRMIGEENVLTIIFIAESEDVDSVDNNNTVIIKKPNNNWKLLYASLWGCRVYMPNEEKRIIKVIEEYNPSFIFFDYSIEGRLVKKCKDYKSVVFFHNIEADYTYSRMKSLGFQLLPAYLAAKKNDKWAAKYANKILCFNKRDSDRLFERYGQKADSCIPISLQDHFDGQMVKGTNQKEIMFLGSCFGPNQDGIEWFVNNVMPRISEISLYIVGKGFEKIKDRLEVSENVHVVGTVDNPSEYYYKYPVVVMPIKYGSGMKVKTAEAMMHGCHIFASDESLEGYEVAGIKGIERCNSVNEYVYSIRKYYSNGRVNGYEQEVRNNYLSKYSSSSVYREFVFACKEIL